ncbi:MAG: hypothetical protein ABFS21_11410, partial [Actinomycetota bacterium]
LVGVAAVFLLIWWAVSALVGVGAEDPPPIVQNLDDYTRCLADHGANVPRVEARSDGGFAIVVPGSLLDDGVDHEAWRAAHDECGEEARVLFDDALSAISGRFFEGLADGSLSDVLGRLDPGALSQWGSGGFGGMEPGMFGEWNSDAFIHPPPVIEGLPPGPSGRLEPVNPERLEDLCERLEDGSISLDRQTLRRLEQRCDEFRR